jgi:PGF-CTERM protein
VVGQALVYLGPHETDTKTAHGQTFRLVVPDAATLAAGREAIFESVTAAADRLRVGDRDPRVLMIAAPASVAWGVRGLQTGDRDFYAVADEPVNAARNVWIHEYVHSRQEFAPGPATRWFTEASAEYYAARLTLDQDRIEFETFADHLAVGSSRRYDDVVLSDPDTWHDSADYFKGSLAAGDLDRRIRLATDSRATLQGVFGRLNDRTDPVSAEAFVEFVTRTAGGSVTDATRRYTLTTATPAMWSVGQHGDAFGTLPPSIRYAFPGAGSDGVRVSGVYRNGTLGVGPLVANETLAVDVRVTNEGGTTGSYDLAFGVDGETVATRTGEVAPGTTAVETVERTFTAPGTYRLTAGEAATTVTVRDPATPLVTALSANRTTLASGGPVELTATVENRADRPGERVLTIQRDGTELLRERVRFGGPGRKTVTATARLPGSGTYRFTAGNASVVVTVDAPGGTDRTATATARGTGDDGGGATRGASGPGFGPLIAVVAVILTVLLGRR